MAYQHEFPCNMAKILKLGWIYMCRTKMTSSFYFGLSFEQGPFQLD